MTSRSYIGEVSQGRGIGKTVIQKHQKEFEKRGIMVFPGTLNVLLKEPVFLDLSLADFQMEQTWFVFKAKINGYPCHILHHPKCPAHILEIISNEELSVSKSLTTGEKTTIEISEQYFETSNYFKKCFWWFFWSFREKRFYSSDRYTWFVGKFLDFAVKLKILRSEY